MFRVAGVLLLFLITYQLAVQAKATHSIFARDESELSSRVDYRYQRTLFNIVWGCVSTTIICAWAAIHPNVPPREGPFKRILRRSELMFWTVVAPEIIPCWALNQLLAAITVRDVYNEGKGYERKSCGMWETLKGWFSLYEIKEGESPGEYSSFSYYMHSERKEVRDQSARSEAIQDAFETLEIGVTTIRDAFLCRSGENVLFSWLVELPIVILYFLVVPIFTFAMAFYATLRDLVWGTSTSFSTDDTHVPTFYAPKHQYSDLYHILLLMTLGAIFGGIHCSGWNFPFPTSTEQKLWHVSSLVVTLIPIAAFPFGFILLSIAARLSPTARPIVIAPGIFILLHCALAYVSARLVLLGLALAHLRRLPPTAFIAINWTKFYPHIF